MARSKVITDVDKGFRALTRKVSGRSGLHVVVGVIGNGAAKQYTDGSNATVVDVAAWNEFGVPARSPGRKWKIPPRSWLRDTIKINERQINENLSKIAFNIAFKGANERQQLAKLGVWVEGLIKKRIAAGIQPPNAESTILSKGSSKPLIDTGQLRNSIISEVRGRGGK